MVSRGAARLGLRLQIQPTSKSKEWSTTQGGHCDISQKCKQPEPAKQRLRQLQYPRHFNLQPKVSVYILQPIIPIVYLDFVLKVQRFASNKISNHPVKVVTNLKRERMHWPHCVVPRRNNKIHFEATQRRRRRRYKGTRRWMEVGCCGLCDIMRHSREDSGEIDDATTTIAVNERRKRR